MSEIGTMTALHSGCLWLFENIPIGHNTALSGQLLFMNRQTETQIVKQVYVFPLGITLLSTF